MAASDTLRARKQKSGLMLFTVVATFLGLIPTVYVTIISNSAVLVADLLRAIGEFVAIFLSWLVLLKTSKRQIARYNYGFGKLEQLGSLCVGVSLFLSFCLALFVSIYRFLNPAVIQGTELGLIFSILSVIGNAYIWSKNASLSQQAPSPVTDSQRKLFRAKTIACLVVVFSLIPPLLVSEGPIAMYADPLGSLIIAGFLFYSAIAVISSSIEDLLDKAIEEAYQFLILKALVKHEGEYKGLEMIKTRRLGIRAHIELFLDFDKERKMLEVQESIDTIKGAILDEIPEAEIVIVSSAK